MRDRSRGQLSLSVLEAAVGVVLLLAVAMGFALGLPTADTRAVQLDRYAQDTATVLSGEPPRHRGATRLSEVVASAAQFDRERDALEHRIERILPDNLMYRVETEYGAVGFRKPANAPVGRASVTTLNGEVTIWVWYA